MSESDPFRYDDGPYVLGALSPEERDAFEDHLLICDACVARVRELGDVPALLQGIDASEIAPEPVPDTLLPRLLRAAARRQRRRRTVIGALAAVAAACVAALVIALWPSSSSTALPQRPFTAVAQVPVQATAVLTPKAWGTAIDVHCQYVHGTGEIAYRYDLIAYDRLGRPHQLGDWRLPPDRDIEYQAGTSLSPHQIARLEITLADGTPVLQLRT
jgi:hypothetical protein